MRVDLDRLKPDEDRAKHDPGEAGANLPNKEKRDNCKHIYFDTVLSKWITASFFKRNMRKIGNRNEVN